MKTQSDSKMRVVSLENLKAMCEERSGCYCHKYWIEKVSRSRVHVGYSNEDEYANSHPMYAVFPCYPNGFQDNKDNPNVVLDFLNIVHDYEDGEGWQNFTYLLDCPVLWRDPENDTWKAE